MTTEDFKRKLTAILSADVVGYSRLMGDNESDTVKTLETYKGVMFSLIRQHRGRVVDSPGDNLLAEFGSVVDAVQCAVSIQKELQTRNADLPENRRMDFRIGINLGDVIEEQGRIYGDGVNIAARLEALADPGGICVSKTAFDHIESKLPLGYEFLGEQTVKNIVKPVGAYKVLMETRVVGAKTKRESKAVSSFWQRKSILSFGIIIILAIAAGLYWNFYRRNPPIEPARLEKMAYSLPDKPSIAVLPFTNMSGDSEQNYIGDGLSDAIISALSVSSEMLVISGTTFIYKGKEITIQQVAEDLGVRYILQGSIKKSGDKLRVTAKLIDALSGQFLWAEVYDGEINEIFEFENKITKKIMVSLQVELSGNEDLRVYAKSTDSLEAWKHYIKGIELFERLNNEDNLRAREHFEAAIDIDQTFVAASSKLAETYLVDFSLEWGESPLVSLNRAIELAQAAVKLDERNPSAHAVLGFIFLYQGQLQKAMIEAKRATTLNPNYSFGFVILAGAMHYSGQFDEAITLCKKAARINPNPSPFLLHTLSISYIFLKRYEEALEVLRQWEERAVQGSRSMAMLKTRFAWLYQELGKEEESRAYMAEALKIKPDYSLENTADDPYENSSHLQRMQNALRKAGMPKHPRGAVEEKPSIAVLPFDDFSPEKNQEYFVNGLSEEILNAIDQIPGLTVKARTSSFSFKGQNKSIQEIAGLLGVDHVLEGSVSKDGNTIRIITRLIRVADSSYLWTETYDRQFKDIFTIREDIAASVAEKLKLTLEAFQLLGGTENVEAYELYLVAKGVYNIDDYNRALESINAAIAIDPEFALAWALKASIHIRLSFSGLSIRADTELDAALIAAQKAIELEPNLPEGYFVFARHDSARGKWIDAELNYRRALRLRPEIFWQSGMAQTYSHTYRMVGYFKKSREIDEELRRNDPLNLDVRRSYVVTLSLLNDTQRVEDENERCKALFGDVRKAASWGITFHRLGRVAPVSREELEYSNPIFDAAKEYLDSPKEGLAKLRQLYIDENNLSEIDMTNISILAAYFGDPEFAMDAMEKGNKIETSGIFKIWYPVMKEVRQLPRFKEFVREIGLVDYWKQYGWPDLCHPIGDIDFICE